MPEIFKREVLTCNVWFNPATFPPLLEMLNQMDKPGLPLIIKIESSHWYPDEHLSGIITLSGLGMYLARRLKKCWFLESFAKNWSIVSG